MEFLVCSRRAVKRSEINERHDSSSGAKEGSGLGLGRVMNLLHSIQASLVFKLSRFSHTAIVTPFTTNWLYAWNGLVEFW